MSGATGGLFTGQIDSYVLMNGSVDSCLKGGGPGEAGKSNGRKVVITHWKSTGERGFGVVG